MAKYAKHIVNPTTSQRVQARIDQIPNHEGGFVFEVDKWTRLNRFLIMGCENGSYYATEKETTIESYDALKECLGTDWKRTVDTIVSISDEGRAVKNLPAIFSLAVCSVFGEEKAREYSNSMVNKVSRFSTDLFTYVDCVNTLKEGRKGKGLLRAIGRWYNEKDAKTVAYQICKYPSRSIDGRTWSHADLFRLARISLPIGNKPSRGGKSLTVPSAEHELLMKYAIHGITTPEELSRREEIEKETGQKQESPGLSTEILESFKNNLSLRYLWAHEQCKKETNINKIVRLIQEYDLTRESIEPSLRNSLEIKRALLPKMPLTALIRNLGGMTSSGLLKPLSDEVAFVIDKITNELILEKARIHPFEALKQYRKKHNPSAKLAVLAFQSNKFSIADPSDAGMLDIAGMDSNVPRLLSEFAVGNL